MAGNYVLLETISLTQNAASVTFDNIPQTGYTDLKIVASTRQTNASIGLKMTINGYSAFSGRVLEGSGSSASSYTMTNQLLAGYNNSSAYTANTFANTEIYIPNYTSTTNKSVSADSVTETNGTTAYMALFADLYTTSSPVTTITFTADNSGNLDSGSTFSLYGIAALGTTPTVAPKATGGNIVANDGTYWYHAFTSSGTFTPQTALTADILVVAGGGGGSSDDGGGGGAGGLVAHTSQSLTEINYTCTIGSGGAGGNATQASQGGNSQFGALTASVGGGWGSTTVSPAGTGGSGGGGGRGGGSIGGSATSGQGFVGGNGIVNSGTGGGGGAGGAGATATSAIGGAGGVGSSAYSAWGLATLTGQNVSGTYYYAGGGGGGSNTTGTYPSGGYGGGGAGGAYANPGTGGTGIANTGGGGGGGGGGYGISTNGAAGGSGIVIIRYAMV